MGERTPPASTAGEAWLRTLDPARRPTAKVWVDMPQDEFQGRMAMAVADIKEELAEMRKPAWKSAAQWFGVVIATAATTALGYSQR